MRFGLKEGCNTTGCSFWSETWVVGLILVAQHGQSELGKQWNDLNQCEPKGVRPSAPPCTTSQCRSGARETYREHLAFFEGALGNDLILSGVNLVDQRCCINVTQLDPTARSSKCNHAMKYPLKRNEEIET